jgi:hypothetical protein
LTPASVNGATTGGAPTWIVIARPTPRIAQDG